MRVQSIIIDNTFGNNISRVSIYGPFIDSLETSQLKEEKFELLIDTNNKSFIQSRLDNLISENLQVMYMSQLFKRFNTKYSIFFEYTNDFFAVWKDKQKTVNYKDQFLIISRPS